MTNAHMLTSKVYVIRNMAYRPSMQVSYAIGLGTTIQENQPAVQIELQLNTKYISSDDAIYIINLYGAGGN